MKRIRQGVDKIFFREVSGEMLRVRDVHDGDGPLERPSTHSMRALRNHLVRSVYRSHRCEDFPRMARATANCVAQLSSLLKTPE